MSNWVKGVGAHARRRQSVNIAMGVVALLLTIAKVAGAQHGCTYTLSIYCGGVIYCTTSAGNNCITCPK